MLLNLGYTDDGDLTETVRNPYMIISAPQVAEMKGLPLAEEAKMK